MKKLKERLGFLYRGIIGFLQNKFEFTPQVPNDIEKFKIGESVSKQDIYAYKINNGKIKFAFGGGIHGNEVGTVKLVKHLINFINHNKEKYEGFSFYFIPIINPDGYKIGLQNPDYFGGGNIGRFNENNVDLNKSFPTKSFKQYSVWSRGDNYSESVKVYCGEKGGDQPETKALINFLQKEKIQIFFNYHSAGGDVQANRNELSIKLNQIYSEAARFSNWTEEDWRALGQTGTLKEWTEENNIAFSEIENTVRWGSDWKNHKNSILKILEYLQSK
jgi:hypothetical protein